MKIGKTRNCVKTQFSTQFLVFPISTRVDITVCQHGKCFIFLKCQFQLNDGAGTSVIMIDFVFH